VDFKADEETTWNWWIQDCANFIRLILNPAVLMLKHELVEERPHYYSKNSSPCTWMIQSQSLFCNICVISVTLYFNLSTLIFLFCILVERVPYMCENFTIHMPEFTKLWIFYLCQFKPSDREKRGI
jgi:hypothetical protein